MTCLGKYTLATGEFANKWTSSVRDIARDQLKRSPRKCWARKARSELKLHFLSHSENAILWGLKHSLQGKQSLCFYIKVRWTGILRLKINLGTIKILRNVDSFGHLVKLFLSSSFHPQLINLSPWQFYLFIQRMINRTCPTKRDELQVQLIIYVLIPRQLRLQLKICHENHIYCRPSIKYPVLSSSLCTKKTRNGDEPTRRLIILFVKQSQQQPDTSRPTKSQVNEFLLLSCSYPNNSLPIWSSSWNMCNNLRWDSSAIKFVSSWIFSV